MLKRKDDIEYESVFVVYETYDDGCDYESLRYEGVRLEEGAFKTYEEAKARAEALQAQLIDKVRKDRCCEFIPGDENEVKHGIEEGEEKDVYFVEMEYDYWTFYPVEIVIN